MSEKKREDHTLDALAHAMVPPAGTPPAEHVETPTPFAQDETAEDLVEYERAHPDGLAQGEVLQRLEDVFPLVWLAMLTIVSVISIYNAVDKLP
jgi:hypothetical protein